MALPLTLPEKQDRPALSESYRTMLADRLNRIRKAHLVFKAARLWPNSRQIPSFGELNPVHEHALQEDVVIFGILVLNSKQRKSAVKTYRTLLEPTVQPPVAEKLVTDGDTYYVKQVVLCGGTYAPVDAGPAAAACLGNALSPTTGFLDLQASYDLVDTILARVAAARPTILVPGQSDPTPRLWPQAPVPSIVLPRCSLTNSLISAPCPAKLLTRDKQLVWVIDGTVLTYLAALIPASLTVPALVATLLQVAHLCPQSPLFFDVQPLQLDAFVLDEPPQYIVVSNHPQTTTPEAYALEYDWKGVQCTCKIFCVPSFTSTGSILCWDPTGRWSTLKLDNTTSSLSQSAIL